MSASEKALAGWHARKQLHHCAQIVRRSEPAVPLRDEGRPSDQEQPCSKNTAIKGAYPKNDGAQSNPNQEIALLFICDLSGPGHLRHLNRYEVPCN